MEEGSYHKGCKGEPNDKNIRVKKVGSAPIHRFVGCCEECAIEEKETYDPGAGYFYAVNGDDPLTLKAYGVENDEFSCNTTLFPTDFGQPADTMFPIDAPLETISKTKENRSKEKNYNTTKAYHIVGSGTIIIEDDAKGISGNVNDVMVHTPIHSSLIVKVPDPNQLTNRALRDECGEHSKIITLGDQFTVRLNVTGHTEWYDRLSGDGIWPARMKKYIKYAELYCPFCNLRMNVTDYVKADGYYEHTCRVYVDSTDDLQNKSVVGRVVAENEQSEERIYEFNNTNTPDYSYAIENKKGMLIVGRLYDLQVRATDDDSWTLKVAENLSKLPTGEKDDNKQLLKGIGIKLGYRAFFDLKTLGTASNTIEIVPKIYYVAKDGTVKGTINNQYELWYRTSKTSFEKLSTNDISITMNMSKTYADTFNTLFSEEKTKLYNRLKERIAAGATGVKLIDYTKNIDIGSLLKISLKDYNTVATKYKYIKKDESDYTIDYTKPEDKSRRWYGEVYLPGSTRIVEAGNYQTNKQKVLNNNYIKDGYLMVVFETVTTTTKKGNPEGVSKSYLKYDEHRTADWNLASGSSQLVKEKAGKGSSSTGTNAIVLPNGQTVKNLGSDFYKTEAPIVIYDLQHRANDDAETGGTH